MKVVLLSVFIIVVSAVGASAEKPERYNAYYYPELYMEGALTDRLQNTSNLTDRDIRWYLKHTDHQTIVKALDRNADRIADGTTVNVHEFIERMKIIFWTIDAWNQKTQTQLKEQPESRPKVI